MLDEWIDENRSERNEWTARPIPAIKPMGIAPGRAVGDELKSLNEQPATDEVMLSRCSGLCCSISIVKGLRLCFEFYGKELEISEIDEVAKKLWTIVIPDTPL